MMFRFKIRAVIAVTLSLATGSVTAQIALPHLPEVGSLPNELLNQAGHDLATVQQRVAVLALTRIERLRAIVRTSNQALEMTRDGPAVRAEIIAVDPDVAALGLARDAGLTVTRDEIIPELQIRTVVLSLPSGVMVDAMLKRLRKSSPDRSFTANHVYFQSATTAAPTPAKMAQPGNGIGGIGLIDGGVGAHPSLIGPIEQRGFVGGSPSASRHGTAVASLIAGSGSILGPAPAAPLLVADVYGNDKAGGNALAIAKALGWMIERKSPVVAMSLVGPPNVLLERAVRAAQARGLTIVAAAGNDGAAAPPAYPASYPDVLAITAVDRHDRVVIEAGNSLHVDFAAPGADLVAANLSGGWGPVRGTSYAVPLVAALAWRFVRTGLKPVPQLVRTAVDLGKPGVDRVYGHGLVCRECRSHPRH